MKKGIIFLGMWIVVLLMPLGLLAQDLKWGYVDVMTAMRQVEKGKKAFEELQQMKSKRQKELEQEEKDLRTEGEELKAQKTVLSDDAFARKNREFARKQLALQQKLETYEMELMKAQDEKAKDILKDMEVIIKEIAEKRGYEIIFEKSGSKLLYANIQNDLTKEVINIYDQRFGKTKKSRGKK